MSTEEKVVNVEVTQEESSTGGTPNPEAAKTTEHTWAEEIEIASDQLVARVKELIAEGNVRRLIIRASDGKPMLEIPLTAGVAVGGVITVFAPILAAIGALAALIVRVKVEIVRVDGEKQ